MSSLRRKSGFTLIELLVVIAIIALLLSILTPALRKAKEHGTNLICQTRQRNVFLAFATYAAENDNCAPKRPDGIKVTQLKYSSSYDLRETLIPYLGHKLESFNDPFCKTSVKFGTSNASVAIEGNYAYYPGFRFEANGKRKFGEPMAYNGKNFYIVSADWMALGNGLVQCAHRGRNNDLQLDFRENSIYAFARWFSDTSDDFGEQKYNYIYTDGSTRSVAFSSKDVVRDSTGQIIAIENTPLKRVPGWDQNLHGHGWATFLPSGR